MKTQKKLALIVLACAAAPAFAQSDLPNCVSSNLDAERNIFTVAPRPGAGAFNQQCVLTVQPKGAASAARGQINEGNYLITLSGGGGGGGSGIPEGYNTGGGGAGAAPLRVTRYVSPGTYKVTLGTGGDGGRACASKEYGTGGQDGSPTSLATLDSAQTIAGFPGADQWAGSTRRDASFAVASGRRTPGQSEADTNGTGGPAFELQAAGGSGAQGNNPATPGGRPKTDVSGQPGKGGHGGGGGAGYGHGGDGQVNSTTGLGSYAAARAGTLGGGGGGGASGQTMCGSGGTGGHGFIAMQPA